MSIESDHKDYEERKLESVKMALEAVWGMEYSALLESMGCDEDHLLKQIVQSLESHNWISKEDVRDVYCLGCNEGGAEPTPYEDLD